jgi:hypothetical protein
MYLSHKYKFLFLRTPKTASSSLSDFFIRNIDDEAAVYTEVEDSGLPGTLSESIVSKYRPYAFYHFTLQQLVDEKVLTYEQASTYKCFALLRNPLDRAKSFYYFYKKFKDPHSPASLEEYRRWTKNGVFYGEANSAIVQTSLLKLRGQPIGEYWLYENLKEELQKFMEGLGLECPPLPQHKTDSRKDRNNEIEFEVQDIQAMNIHFIEDFYYYNKQIEKNKWEDPLGYGY